MPVLSNVLIEAEGDHIDLTTTNLDLGIRCRVKANVSSAGSITLPVRRLAGIVRELPAVEVQAEVSANHQVRLTSGGSNFRIMGIPRDDFPPLPEFADEHAFTLEQKVLGQMISSVSYAQSADESRYFLNGVYFDFSDGKLTLVATDGRRLALVHRETEFGESEGGSLILPAKTVSELARLLSNDEKFSVSLSFNDRRVAFKIEVADSESGLVDQVHLISKVVEGNYPNYQQVIPKEVHQRVQIDRELFLQCVHRAALVTSDKSNSAKIKLSTNLLEITAASPDFGEAHESLAVDYSGPDLQVAFNPGFLMDPLKALTKDQVAFELKDELSPGVFKTDGNFLCVVMPVRL
jgi:DNA polymerase-3 subunit beta